MTAIAFAAADIEALSAAALVVRFPPRSTCVGDVGLPTGVDMEAVMCSLPSTFTSTQPLPLPLRLPDFIGDAGGSVELDAFLL
jgi:hypothetical protein